MKKILLALALLVAGAMPAVAQSGCPTIVYGAVLTAAQWNACFAAKQNTLGFTPLNKAGDTMTGILGTTASTPLSSGFRLIPGAAPTSPVNGDMWTTSAGAYVRINGATVGPLVSAASSIYAAPTAPSPATIYQLWINTTTNPAVLSQYDGAQWVSIGTLNTSTHVWTPSGVSIGLSLPSIFSVSGSPSTAVGTLGATLATQTANTIWSGPTTGSAAAPTFRALVGADLPNPSSSTLGGIQSYAAVSNQWINAISTSGVPSSAQPAFSNLSGTIATGQVSGSYTGITGVGALTAGSLASGFTPVTNALLANSAVTIGSTSVSLGATASTIAGLTLTTPNIGAATATSINGLTLTASTGALTIANGKTLTASNTLTFTGTDSSSVNFGAGGTVLYSGGSYVSSLAGTANEITASAATGAVTLSLPSALTFTGKTVTGGSFANPTITGSFTATGLVTNAALANPATTVNGQTCTLGSTCTVAAAAGTLTGSTLAAGVTASSLTSVGTITTGVWNAGAVTSSGIVQGTQFRNNSTNPNGSLTPVLYANYNGAGNTIGLIMKEDFGSGGTYDAIQFWRNVVATPTQVGSINTTLSGTAYITTSDQRLKDHIEDANEDSGAIIDALRVRQWDWKSDKSHENFGFVAQELYKVYPAAVSKGDDDPTKITKQWGREDSKLVPVLVKEIQALRRRVTTLEAAH